jgi:FixJ family two-component response regulator
MSSDKKQIYIVDDDESVCRALKLLLVIYGFAVETFVSAEKFFSSVSNSTEGCLILDLHLPGLNGWDTQKRIRDTGFNRPIIFISTDIDDNHKGQALKAGAVGFLQKPFDDHALIGLIKVAFEQKK